MRFHSLNRLFFKSRSNCSIDTPSTPAAPLLALTLRYASHTMCLEISNGFTCDLDSLTWLLPATRLTTKRTRTTRPLRSARITGHHRYYKAVRPPAAHRYSPPRRSAAWGSPFHRPASTHRPASSQRGVPTFRASAQTELAPPSCRTTTRAVDRYPPGSSRGNNWTPVPIVIATLTTLQQWFTHVRLFRGAHHPGSFTGATHGGLQPPPAGRLWRAHPSLSTCSETPSSGEV